MSSDLICPVCNLPIECTEYTQHIEHCLTNADPGDTSDHEEEEDVEIVEGLVETYTWAGHTRVRATSLVEGGLRGPGFVEITHSSEDQILDIEGNDDEEDMLEEFASNSQYTENDLILPKPETEAEVEELESRTCIQEVLTGQRITSNNVTKCDSKNSSKDEASLSQPAAVSCAVCMDSYRTPLVSTVCWHVSCEECWMRALGTKKLCPQCKVIIQPKHLRRIYL